MEEMDCNTFCETKEFTREMLEEKVRNYFPEEIDCDAYKIKNIVNSVFETLKNHEKEKLSLNNDDDNINYEQTLGALLVKDIFPANLGFETQFIGGSQLTISNPHSSSLFNFMRMSISILQYKYDFSFKDESMIIHPMSKSEYVENFLSHIERIEKDNYLYQIVEIFHKGLQKVNPKTFFDFIQFEYDLYKFINKEEKKTLISLDSSNVSETFSTLFKLLIQDSLSSCFVKSVMLRISSLVELFSHNEQRLEVILPGESEPLSKEFVTTLFVNIFRNTVYNGLDIYNKVNLNIRSNLFCIRDSFSPVMFCSKLQREPVFRRCMEKTVHNKMTSLLPNVSSNVSMSFSPSIFLAYKNVLSPPGKNTLQTKLFSEFFYYVNNTEKSWVLSDWTFDLMTKTDGIVHSEKFITILSQAKAFFE